MSVATPDAFFGHAIHRPAAGHARAQLLDLARGRRGSSRTRRSRRAACRGGARPSRPSATFRGRTRRCADERDLVAFLDPELLRKRCPRVAGHLLSLPRAAAARSVRDGRRRRSTPEFRSLQRTELTHGAWIDHVPGWVSGHDALFEELEKGLPWRRETMKMYDKTVDVPRLLARVPRPGIVDEMRAAISRATARSSSTRPPRSIAMATTASRSTATRPRAT